jgi:hypothetical protein
MRHAMVTGDMVTGKNDKKPKFPVPNHASRHEDLWGSVIRFSLPLLEPQENTFFAHLVGNWVDVVSTE